MQRAHHKRQSDEGAGDDDAERRVGDLDAKGLEKAADPAVAGVERGQRDAGHRRRQSKGQVDDGVEQALAGKFIAHKHPGDQRPEDGVDACACECSAETELKRRPHSWRPDHRPEAVPTQSRRLGKDANQGNQDEQAQVENREPERQAKARQGRPAFTPPPRRYRDSLAHLPTP